MKINQFKSIRIVLLYFIFSLCWILFGADMIAIPEKVKGILFVMVTTVFLYFAIKKQQKAMLVSAKQYKDLFYSSPIPMWIYDSSTLAFLDVNNAAIEVYGYSAGEFKGMTLLDIRKGKEKFRMSDPDTPDDDLTDARYFEHFKKNGEQIIALVNTQPVIFNQKEALMDIAQDVTRQLEKDKLLKLLYSTEKELKEELEQNIVLIERSLEEKQRMAEVIERIYNMVLIIDPSGKITWVNQAFVNFTGYSLEEAAGKTTDFLHGPHTDPETLARINEAIKHQQFSVFEILNYTKSGQEYWVELAITAIYNEHNEIARYISVQTVITERKAHEEKIKQQHVILKKLAWTNSHAFRKPVASILSLVDLSKDVKHLEELQEIHRHIAACSKELDDLTREVGTVITDRKRKN